MRGAQEVCGFDALPCGLSVAASEGHPNPEDYQLRKVADREEIS
ncbi:MAG TPA: hypothetical protein VGL65_14075 [Gemmatimonadales bacterium]|jgi:hypothetical protein